MKTLFKNPAIIALLGGLTVAAQAQVIGGWQGAGDGWSDWGNGLAITDPANMPGKYNFVSGVVPGYGQSLQLMQSGWNQGLSIKLQNIPGGKAAFLNNHQFSITWSIPAGTGGGYEQLGLYINAENYGFHLQPGSVMSISGSGSLNGDNAELDFYAGSPMQTQTVTWDYGSILPAIAAGGTDWIELIVASNPGGDAPGIFYFNNAVFGGPGTVFTYQGRLNANSRPANGLYDLRFVVWDALSNGNLVAGPLTNSATSVINGLFNVMLDFGSGVFTGPNRWLEIGVRTNGPNSPEFSTLLPRQPLTPVPYAIFANTANNVSGTISAAQLSGTAGNFLATNIIVTGSITGNGAGLTGLDASQVSRGTIPLAQLPGEVLTNNAPGVVYSVISTNVYFVRIGGDDTNVGMDLARPLATLSNALALANANSPALIDLGVGCFYASSSYVMTNVSIVGKGPQLTKIDVSTAANVNGLVIQGDNVSISELSIGTNNLNTTAWYMPIMYLAGTNVSFFHVVAMGNNDVFHSIDSGTNRGSITIDSCRLESGFDTINFSVTAMNPLDVTLRNTISEIKWNDGFGSNLFGGVHISSSGTWVVENCVFHQTNPEYSLLAPQYCDATIIVCGNVYNSNPIDLNDSQAMLVVKGTIALSEVNNSDYGTVIYDDCFLRAGTNGPVDGSLLTGVSAESAKGIFNSGSPVLRPIATNYYTTIVPQGNTNLLIFNQAGTNLFGAGAGLVFSYSVTAGALTNGGGIGSFIEQLGVLGFTNADFPTVQNPLAQPAEGISLATSDWYDSAFNDWESVTSTWGDLTVTNNSYQYQCGGDTNATVAYIGNGSGLTCLPATGLVFGTTNLYVHISGTNVTFTTTP